MTSDTFDKIFDQVAAREGGEKSTNDPRDTGGRTQWGVSEKSNPGAWADGKVTLDEAKEIFLDKYVTFPKFHLIPASHFTLQQQIIDFGFNSGPQLAIQKLQALLKVDVDGVLGPATLTALTKADPRTLNNQLVVTRVMMIARIVVKDPSQVRFVVGLVDRALSFLV